MDDPSSRILRQVGNLERYSTVRHNLGYYICVCTTARYSIPNDLSSLLESALSKVILQHPRLCCGIIDEDKDTTSFIRLDSIDLSKLIEHRHIEASSLEEYELELLDILGSQHGKAFPDLHCLPAWKIIVVQSEVLDSEKGKGFDVVFAFHHAIGDGLSGVVFHDSLLEALDTSTDLTKVPKLEHNILKIPTSISIHPPVEDVIKVKPSWSYFFSQLWKYIPTYRWLFPPSHPWTASPHILPSSTTRLKLISLPSSLTNLILAQCRAQKATLTGLIHALTILALSRHLSAENAKSFVGNTPYSLRHLTGLSPTSEIGVEYSSLMTSYSAPLISSLRSTLPNATLTQTKLWNLARNFKNQMSSKLSTLPHGKLEIKPKVEDLHAFFKDKIGKRRVATFEISNVGAYRDEREVQGSSNIEKMIFSQSSMVLGAAIGISVVSVRGGPLSICFGWQEGVIDSGLVDNIVVDLEIGLRGMNH